MTDTTSLRREKLAFSIAEVMEVHIAIGPTTTADKAVEIFELLGPIFADLARVTAERDAERAVAEIVEYVLQDDLHNRLTPRVVDIAYSAFMAAKRPNSEDGGPSDWFNDTKPMVMEQIAKISAALVAAAKEPRHE